jgi:hypothetical protein
VWASYNAGWPFIVDKVKSLKQKTITWADVRPLVSEETRNYVSRIEMRL